MNEDCCYPETVHPQLSSRCTPCHFKFTLHIFYSCFPCYNILFNHAEVSHRLVQVLPLRIPFTPLNVDCVISSKPVTFLSVSMQHVNDRNVCKPLDLRTMFCHVSGVLHLRRVATLNNRKTAVMMKNFIPCCCMYSLQYAIVVTTLSGCDCINEWNKDIACCPSNFPSFLTTSFTCPCRGPFH